MKTSTKTKIQTVASVRRQRLKFHQTLKFQKGFLWGTATSAHQVEGDNKNSDWWAWEKKYRRRFDSGRACGHYRRFEQDFRQLGSSHQTAHRLSIEWARIEPRPGE